MTLLLALVFLSTVVAILALGTALDSRSSRARTLRERLKAIESAERRGSNPEMAVLRDELLSEIPALNKLLGRWSMGSRLYLLLEQANLKLRPGKFLLMWACTAGVGGLVGLALTQRWIFALLGLVLAAMVPIGWVLLLRRSRFKKFEAALP